MATNKHAQIRYNILDKCFRNIGRNYTLEDLLEECNRAIHDFDPNSDGIQKRQLYEDIRFMCSEQGWRIELLDGLKKGRKRVYRYSDVKFSISNRPLNENDAIHLKSALITLSRFQGLPQFEWIGELIVRLEDSFNLTKDVQNIISFEENLYLRGRDYITHLYDAIHYKKVLQIKYKNFKVDELQTFNLHPYYLKQYNNRWFLFGKDMRYKTISNLALDRIENIKQIDEIYMETDIDFEDYFEDIIGVSIDQKPVEKVLLKVSDASINYILTKPLHGSQKHRKITENENHIEIEVTPNYELETLILSFGDNIEVLIPESLRKRLTNRINGLYIKYS